MVTIAGTMLSSGAVGAASGETPEGFVRRVYARYAAHGSGVATTRPAGALFYAAEFLDAFAAAEASVPSGDIGPIDYDPICSCQDYEGLKLLTVARTAPGSTKVRATFANMGRRNTVTLSLVATPSGWRIADIADRDIKSVAAVLRDAAKQRP